MDDMKEASLISVVIPVFNLAPYIEQCAESVRHQTYCNLEIILVDDGSTDESGTICDRIAAQDGRIRVIHQENGGPSKARNTGIDHASGDYLLFVDGDDTIRPEMVEILLKRLLADSSEIAMCGVLRVYDDGATEYDTVQDAVVSGFEALEMSYGYKGWLFCSMIVNKLYRRKLFDEIRFPVGKFHEDEATVYKILDLCSWVSIVSDAMYTYPNRSNSTMNSPYSVKRLDGIEASYQRYMYYRKKGGQYLDLLPREGDLFTPLYFRSKQSFVPMTAEEKQRVHEIDRMAREICMDRFFQWSLPRKIKLLNPNLYIGLGKSKRRIRKLSEKAPQDFTRSVQRFQSNRAQFGTKLALYSFTNMFSDGYSDLYIKAFSDFMIRDLQELIRCYNNGIVTEIHGKMSFEGVTPVWTCWWQGEAEMPSMVKACIHRNRQVLPTPAFAFHVITEDNVEDYLDLPSVVKKKYKDGKISKAWYSDILRWGLMSAYGGLWLDTTFYLTQDSAQDYSDVLAASFYTQKCTSEAEAPHEPSRGKWCNGFLAGDRHAVLFSFVYEALIRYWKKYDQPADYVFLDYIIWAGYSAVPEIRKLIDDVPANNMGFWNMFEKMNDPYDEIQFRQDMTACKIYKLPYKGELMVTTDSGKMTNYGYILKENGISIDEVNR